MLRALASGDGDAAAQVAAEGSIILVGERAAQSPGALSAVVALAEATGARLAWVPRRAGERGALEAGALAGLLPWGRPLSDPDARAQAAQAWDIDADALPAETGLDLAGVVEALAADHAEAQAATAASESTDAEPTDPTTPTAPERRIGAVILAGVEAADTPDPRGVPRGPGRSAVRPRARDPVHRGHGGRRRGPAGRGHHREVRHPARLGGPRPPVRPGHARLDGHHRRPRPVAGRPRDGPPARLDRGGRPARRARRDGPLAGPAPRGAARRRAPPPSAPAPVRSSWPAGGTCSTRASSSAGSRPWPAPPARPWPGSRPPPPTPTASSTATRSR